MGAVEQLVSVWAVGISFILLAYNIRPFNYEKSPVALHVQKQRRKFAILIVLLIAVSTGKILMCGSVYC